MRKGLSRETEQLTHADRRADKRMAPTIMRASLLPTRANPHMIIPPSSQGRGECEDL